MSDHRRDAIAAVEDVLTRSGCATDTAYAVALECLAAIEGHGYRHVVEPIPRDISARPATPETAARALAHMRAELRARQDQQ
jgi:hypothetical protein